MNFLYFNASHTPRLIRSLLTTNVRQISVTSKACFLLTKGGRLTSWGVGLLGIGSSDRIEEEPYWNKKLRNSKLYTLSSCSTHIVGVTADEAYAWGINELNVLGLSSKANREQFIPIVMQGRPDECIEVSNKNRSSFCFEGFTATILPEVIKAEHIDEEVKPFDLHIEPKEIYSSKLIILGLVLLFIIIIFIYYFLIN